MENLATELEQKTRNYWELSSIWNGRSSKTLTIERGLRVITDNLNMTWQKRPLWNRFLDLQSNIISGSGPTKPHSAEIRRIGA